MDLETLQKVALELDELLVGGFVNKIHQPLPREIVLRVRTKGTEQKKLILSADPKYGRIHLTNFRIPNPRVPPRFCAFLRAHFQGSRIVRVEAASDDRVVFVRGTRGHATEQVQRDLVLELLGRDSNILLIDHSTNEILDCMHRIPQKETGNRVVLPQFEYFPPPPGKGGSRAFRGSVSVNQGPSRESNKNRNDEKLTFPDLTSGHSAHAALTNSAVDSFFGPLVESSMLEAFRRQVAAPIKSRIRSLERRVEKIRLDADRLSELAQRQQEGELLKSNLGLVQKGLNKITVQDWNTGHPVTIRLNPALDAVGNMNFFFVKSAKGKRGEKMVAQRMAQTVEEKEALEDLLFLVKEARTVAELERFSGEFVPLNRLSTPPASGTRSKIKGPFSGMIEEFKTPSGREVLVGKTGKGNDFLLRHKARRGDFWFHVKGHPGAQVLLLDRGGGKFDASDLEFAAGLAARFSRVRGTGKVEIMFTDVKEVQRIAGSVPGRVTVKTYNTIVVQASNSRSSM